MEKLDYQTMKVEDMLAYIDKYAPQKKEWFKGVALNAKGSYSHFSARKAFCEEFMPEIIPVGKVKQKSKASVIDEWLKGDRQ